VRVRAQGDAERPGKTKVGELEVVPLVDQQILRLQVAMQDPVRMAVQQPRGHLPCEFLEETVVSASTLKEVARSRDVARARRTRVKHA
jgi:hypothetical protein